MRITNSSMMSSYLKDMQKNLGKMNKLNTQLNTGKVISKVSDDPYEAIKILNLQNEISDMEKYNSNADEVMGWLDVTDESLDRIGSLTTDIRTLLVSIQGTYGPDEIKATQTEINEKIKQIGEALNTTYAGKFIFGGSITDEQPIEITEENGVVKLVINNANDKRLNDSLVVEISDGISLEHNLTLNKITSTAGKETGIKNGLEILNGIVSTLNQNNPVNEEELKKLRGDLDTYLSDILNNRALVGGKSNTVSAIKDSNDENILEMKGSYSMMQDVDFAEYFMELQEAQMMYTASLQVGSKLLQSTLLDYMR